MWACAFFRFLDGHVVAIDLSENHLVGALPVGLLPRLPYLEAFRVHGNECYGTIDVELLRAKCRVRVHITWKKENRVLKRTSGKML